MELTLDISALSSDGRGIARRPGQKTFFVSGALPGEKVSARPAAEHKTFCEAETVRILASAPHAVDPPCPHAGECGGCPLMRMDYAEQLVWKRRFVTDAVTRIAGLSDAPIGPIRPSPAVTACRNRVELAFGLDGEGRVCLGMRRRGSHAVISTPQCAMMPEKARAAVARLEQLARESRLTVYDGFRNERGPRRGGGPARPKTGFGFLRFCQIRSGRIPDDASLASASSIPAAEGLWVVLLTSPGSTRERERVRALASELLLDCPEVHAVIHEERRTADMLVRGEKRLFAMGRPEYGLDPSLIVMPLNGMGYLVDAADFFQVNTAAADVLCRTAMEKLETEDLIDLYCGAGAPGLSIASRSVLGVEYSRSAVAAALRNARRFGTDGRYEAGDAAKVLSSPAFRTSDTEVVLCDPPRAGMTRPVIDYIRDRKPARMLYISCNPATLARDLGALADCCTPTDITPVDLFPHTPHVETVVLLSAVRK
ncbi:MAG: class I SAM-dependent RNA methyltransferase [Desulfovibrionaceae bacterium]|nr:class I SAM-dependent RNA methyltransferase [Desulfovibrionaceae bacterium]